VNVHQINAKFVAMKVSMVFILHLAMGTINSECRVVYKKCIYNGHCSAVVYKQYFNQWGKGSWPPLGLVVACLICEKVLDFDW
jgi:hypothetical protein